MLSVAPIVNAQSMTAFTQNNNDGQIIEIKAQLVNLIQQLISQLQLQIADMPFKDSTYSETSSVKISNGEKKVTYEYNHEPCGTLMSDYAPKGSVSVGRGPVYGLALAQCRSINTNLVPDDNSFRTYSCENKSYLDSQNVSGPIFAKATFAFQCK